MYSLSCKNMGVTCDYVATAGSREEVMEMATEHVKKVHPEKGKEMAEKMSKEEMEQSMMEKMVESDDPDEGEDM